MFMTMVAGLSSREARVGKGCYYTDFFGILCGVQGIAVVNDMVVDILIQWLR